MNLLDRFNTLCRYMPHALIALVGRIGIAGMFWRSGQTKVEGFKFDIVEGRYEFGWPRFADATIELFRDEYKLPVIPPEIAAVVATAAEHVFPVLLLIGLATRVSALALLAMTLVIQIFVYPGAWPIHATWAAALLYLIGRGAGALSLDALIKRSRQHGRDA